MANQISHALTRIGLFLNHLNRTAEQLSVEAKWAIILSGAFIKWLRGRVLDPVADGYHQYRLHLIESILKALGFEE